MIDAVVMAHGRQERLAAELGPKPKQALSLGLETILGRTLRLLRELGGIGRITVCGPQLLRAFGDGVVHQHHVGDPDATLVGNMRAAAGDDAGAVPRLYLLGDVVWSRGSLKRVIGANDSPLFFGRIGANAYTRKPYGELFGARVAPDELGAHGACKLLWELKAAMVAPMLFVYDWTDDVDTREDFVERFPLLCAFAAADP
jgi:hypothetical protein